MSNTVTFDQNYHVIHRYAVIDPVTAVLSTIHIYAVKTLSFSILKPEKCDLLNQNDTCGGMNAKRMFFVNEGLIQNDDMEL